MKKPREPSLVPRPSQEPLSQAEIDDLLKAISSGPDDEIPSPIIPMSRKIKIYDFMRPDRMTKSNLRLMANYGDIVATDLAKHIFAKFHKEAHVHIASVDQLTFEEFVRSTPCPCPFTSFKWNGADAYFELDPCLTFYLLGIESRDTGIVAQHKKSRGESIFKNREFNEAEIKRYEKLIQKPFLQLIRKSVSKIENVKTPNFSKVTFFNDPSKTNRHPLAYREMVCLLTFEVSVGSGFDREEGMMNVAMDWRTAVKIMKETNKEPETKSLKKDIGMDAIADTKVPIDVRLGSTSKTLKEVINLGEGSIIPLDKLAGEPVDILANGKPVAKGEVVVIDENFGVRIVELV